MATFLGRKLNGNDNELGNDFSTRIEGTRRLRHGLIERGSRPLTPEPPMSIP